MGMPYRSRTRSSEPAPEESPGNQHRAVQVDPWARVPLYAVRSEEDEGDSMNRRRGKGCQARHSEGGVCDDKRESHAGEPHHRLKVTMETFRWWEVECDANGDPVNKDRR